MIRVFPSRTSMTPTDALAFVGDPPMFRPEGDPPVSVSVTFTWEKAEGLRLVQAWRQFYSDVRIGGPAFDDPGAGFVPGRFVAEGCVMTSRGCPRRCGFCLVPAREGGLRTLPITDGWNVLDSNLLACPESHVDAVFEMLDRQPRAAVFSGGLDTRIFGQRHADLMRSIRLKEMWFACDDRRRIRELRRVADLITDISTEKKRCYVLVGFQGETVAEAESRLEEVFETGFLPFAQVFRDATGKRIAGADWTGLQKRWCRPAAYRPRKVAEAVSERML